MFLNVNMTTWHKATLPPRPPPKVAVVCENGDQVRDQLVVAGSASWQMLSTAPWCPGSAGDTRGGGCLRLAGLLTWRLAALPGDLKVTMLAPDCQPDPVKGELPFF